MKQFWPYLLVGAGGFLGANARFLLSRFVGLVVDTRFPLGTFVVNASGCFALGVLGTLAMQRVVHGADELRLAVGIGFLGAFTTFSTFGYETHALLEEGAWGAALANAAGSVLVGLIAVRSGILVARAWLP